MRFECDHCGLPFPSKAALLAHLDNAHACEVDGHRGMDARSGECLTCACARRWARREGRDALRRLPVP